MYVSVLEGRLGGALGVDWLPLPTRPQRYCDPASLVFGVVKLISVIVQLDLARLVVAKGHHT